MKLILTGSLGNVGQPLTEILAGKGHEVTVISSNPEKAGAIRAAGAVPAIGSVHDTSFLENTFTGADAVYLMIPPDYTQPDHVAYCRALAGKYKSALEHTGVTRAVFLSSWGAHLDKGTGPIVGSYHAEHTLNTIRNISLTHLRPTSFFTNLYSFADMIRQAGFIGTNYGGEDRIVMVHPKDIATAAAQELESTQRHASASAQQAPPPQNPHIRYVAGDEHTATEIAHILGAAIGRPGLQWLTFTDDQTREALLQSGLPPHLAAGLVELGNAMHNERLHEDYYRNQPAAMGKIKTEDFAREFATRF